MKKRTFLGFDITPRAALWRKIGDLQWDIDQARGALRKASIDSLQKTFATASETGQIVKLVSDMQIERANRRREFASLTESLRKAEAERVEALKKCAELEERLARYDRPKDSKGRFCKRSK